MNLSLENIRKLVTASGSLANDQKEPFLDIASEIAFTPQTFSEKLSNPDFCKQIQSLGLPQGWFYLLTDLKLRRLRR